MNKCFGLNGNKKDDGKGKGGGGKKCVTPGPDDETEGDTPAEA